MAGATVAGQVKIPRYASQFQSLDERQSDASLMRTAIESAWQTRVRRLLPNVDVSRLRFGSNVAVDDSGLYAVLTFHIWTPSPHQGPTIADALSDDTVQFFVVADDMPFGREAAIISDAKEYARRTLVRDVLDIIEEGGAGAVADEERQKDDVTMRREISGRSPDDPEVPENAISASTAAQEAENERGVIVDVHEAEREDVAKGRTIIGMPEEAARVIHPDQDSEATMTDVVSAEPVPNAGDRPEAGVSGILKDDAYDESANLSPDGAANSTFAESVADIELSGDETTTERVKYDE